jgi:hypothetical protein
VRLAPTAQPRVLAAEQRLAQLGWVEDRQPLQVAVVHRLEPVEQQRTARCGEQVLPLGAPEGLEYVPAGAGEDTFELVEDATVAAHRPVEALQVAVDDEDEVVQVLARRQPDRGRRLRLVGLTVAHEAPHPSLGRIGETPGGEISVEPGLVHRVQRTDAEAHGRELPELAHAAGMRVRRQAVSCAGDLSSEEVELLGGQPSFEEGSGIDARTGVSLEEDLVAGDGGLAFGSTVAEEVLEPHLPQRQRRGVGRKVTTEPGVPLVGPHHHRHRVPTQVGVDPLLDSKVTRVRGSLRGRDGVAVRRSTASRNPLPRA